MEIFFEKNVVNENIDKHKKRNVVFNVIRILSIVILVIEIYFILSFQGIPVDQGALAVVLSIFSSVIMILPPITSIVLFSLLLSRFNAEYDYYIAGDVFRVMQVLNRKKRKKFLEASMSAISEIGTLESENFERYNIDKSIKKMNAFCNDDSLLGYIYFSLDGEKKLLILELDDEFLFALRKALPMSVLDNSVKKIILEAAKKNDIS